jgi:hypothetical protein
VNKHSTLGQIAAEPVLDDEAETPSTFKVVTRIVDDVEHVVPQARALRDWLRSRIQYQFGYDERSARADSFPISRLVKVKRHLKDIVDHEELGPEAAAILTLIGARAREMRKASLERLANGEALFDDLEHYFAKDAEVVVRQGEDMVGGQVVQASIQASIMGVYLSVQFRGCASVAGGLAAVVQKAVVPAYGGLAKLSDLPVRTPTADEKAALTERGRIYRDLSMGNGYASYEGTLTRAKWWNEREYRAKGRIMADAKAFKMIDPDGYADNVERRFGIDSEHEGDKSLHDSQLWSCIPYIFGFSFAAKAWGRMRVADVRPIAWRHDAFDQVVLPEDDKQLVKALVQHHGGTFEDLVEGKGGGLIFMLHGEPGQGKTLLAETTAEVLQRPLYMISVGELGTDPDELEERLRRILDLADTWNAVLLLDEADIFLEARDEKDIVRNAMVGVFLRLLEYHQGVLFLTTNRVRNIDRAFMSRISLALSFGVADQAKRKAIWTNLLTAAGLDPRLAQALSHYDLNGRQIKNVIRLTQTLAKGLGTAPSMELFERVVSRVTAFTSH